RRRRPSTGRAISVHALEELLYQGLPHPARLHPPSRLWRWSALGLPGGRIAWPLLPGMLLGPDGRPCHRRVDESGLDGGHLRRLPGGEELALRGRGKQVRGTRRVDPRRRGGCISEPPGMALRPNVARHAGVTPAAL